MSTTAEIPAPVPDSFEQHLKNRGMAQLWLTLLTFAVYAMTLLCGFVYDDYDSIVHNNVIKSWSLTYFTGNFSQLHGSNFYRPVTGLYMRAVYSMCGATAWGWHLSSVLLHLVCVLLVFSLARRLLLSRTAAFIAAALFATHPTHVEAVTWASAVADLLMTVFLLTAAWAFLSWREGKAHALLLASIAAGAAAVFTKETAVVIPVLISALVILPGAVRSMRVQLAAASAFWVEALGYLAIRSNVLHSFAHPLSRATNTEMMLSWPGAILFYAKHMVFPEGMTILPSFDFVHSAKSPEFIWPLLAVLAMAIGIAYLIWRSSLSRLYLACIVWIAAPLAPAMYLRLFPPYELVHDRFLYIPTIGFCIAAAVVISSIPRNAYGSSELHLQGLTAILLIGISAAACVGYESWWQNDVTLFTRAVSITPNNARALSYLGYALLEHKQYDAAIKVLDRALQQEPNYARPMFDRGRAAWETGDNATAERCFERAAMLAPDATRWLTLSGFELSIGKTKNSEMASREALAAEPNSPNAHFALGIALLAEGDKSGAISEFEEELRRHPGTPGVQQALTQARSQN